MGAASRTRRPTGQRGVSAQQGLSASYTVRAIKDLQSTDRSSGTDRFSPLLDKGDEMNNQEQFLRLPQVIALTALSRSSIYAYIQKKAFPAPVKISGPGGRSVAWTASSIAAWQKSCIQAANSSRQENGAAVELRTSNVLSKATSLRRM